MSHLGHWLTALVDGELDGVERDRVLNHVAGCDPCLSDVSAMRALKRRLTALGETPASPAVEEKRPGIEDRLLDLARGPKAGFADAMLARPARRIEHGPRVADWGPRLVTQSWRLAAGSAGGALLAIGALAFMLGSGAAEPPAPRITPSVDSYLIQHAYDAGQAPAGSVPAVGNLPAGQGLHTFPASPALARPGWPAAQRSGGVSGITPAAGIAASPTTGVATPAASPVASPPASPAGSGDSAAPPPAGPPAGLHAAGRHPR